MINELHVTNFKSLRGVHLSDLGKINIVVGDNGAGKTALLESIFLSQIGSPEIVLRLRLWRSLGPSVAFTATRDSYESIWRDLFCGFDQTQSIEIRAKGDLRTMRFVKVYYDQKDPASISTQQKEGRTELSLDQFSAINPITFEVSSPEQSPIKFRPKFQNGTFSFGESLGGPSSAAFYACSFSSAAPPGEAASQFSSLSRKNKSSVFVKQMKKLYPIIRDISVEVDGAGSPQLCCEVAHLPEKVPIGLLSSGMHKLASLLLGISQHEGGVVLIDEIENGFYYKKLPEMWAAINSFSKAFNVQVFATTHSDECLKAIGPLLETRASDFRLIRMESVKGYGKAKMFQGDELKAAVETGVEFR